MPAFPIPVFGAVLLCFVLLRLMLREDRSPALAVLIAACAVQAMLIALAQHYGVNWARAVQPSGGAILPPLTWVVFQLSAVRRVRVVDALHLIGPALVPLSTVAVPALLDPLIPALYAGYGAAILWRLRGGADALPRLALTHGDGPRRVWQGIGVALLASALSDVAVVVAIISGRAEWQPWIISLASALMLVLIGLLSLSQSLQAPAEPAPPTRAPEEAAGDRAMLDRLTALMEQRHLYRDADLTLSQLARRLYVPAKTLSAAINRETGENTSRYINNYRIRDAARLIEGGATITTAMFEAGFNTKSNFNREFLRVTGKSPSAWRASGGG